MRIPNSISRPMVALGLLALVCALVWAPVQAHDSDPPGIAELVAPPTVPIDDLARRAELIVKARVVRIQYKDSQDVPILDDSGRPVLDDNGRPAMQDGSNLPHAFVTFRILETLKGKNSGTITLRFLGGLGEETITEVDASGQEVRSPRFVTVSRIPFFDVGDVDYLFVERNGLRACPLVNCRDTRFRVIGGKVFSDAGHEIVNYHRPGDRAEAVVGPFRELSEVETNSIGQYQVKYELSRPDDPQVQEGPQFRLAPQFGDAGFRLFLAEVVRRSHTLAELLRTPRVESSDPTQPFQIEPLTAETAPPGAQSRPDPVVGTDPGITGASP